MKNITLKDIIFTILIVLLLICQIIRVEPRIVWSSETYIGIFVTLMGIAVAVIVGYQAINAHDIKQDLKEQRSENENLKDEVKRQINDIKQDSDNRIKTFENEVKELRTHADTILVSTQESVSILNALIFEMQDKGDGKQFFFAFEAMHRALLLGLDYESKNVEFIFDKLEEYYKHIVTQSFGGFSVGPEGLTYCNPPYKGRTLRSVLDTEYLPLIKEVESKIREHKNFTSISYNYTALMNKFYERINKCASRFYPKEDEIKEVL